MSKHIISPDDLADTVRKLDKAAADGSSRGTLRARLDFAATGAGKIGLVGRASLSQEIAALAKLLPAELAADSERVIDWASDADLDLRWDFGPPAQIFYGGFSDAADPEGRRHAVGESPFLEAALRRIAAAIGLPPDVALAEVPRRVEELVRRLALAEAVRALPVVPAEPRP